MALQNYIDRFRALVALPVRRLRSKAAANHLGGNLPTVEETGEQPSLTEAAVRAERRSPKFGEYVAFADDEPPPPPNASLRRRISTKHAAKYLGRHPRTLEKWRNCWRQAELEGKPELRQGPRFLAVEGRIFYTIADLNEFKAAEKAHGRRLWL